MRTSRYLFTIALGLGLATVASQTSATAGSIDMHFTTLSRNFTAIVKCTGSPPISVQVADDGIDGDLWRAAISKTSGASVEATSNQTVDGDVLAIGLFSPPVDVQAGNALVTLMSGDGTPGGFPGGFFARFSSPPNKPIHCNLMSIFGGILE